MMEESIVTSMPVGQRVVIKARPFVGRTATVTGWSASSKCQYIIVRLDGDKWAGVLSFQEYELEKLFR